MEIRSLSNDAATRDGLAALLVDVVEQGGLVHFMAPLALEDARSFWTGVLEAAARGERLVFGAFEGAVLVGTVSLILNSPPNAPHRAEVSKMMTLSSHRRRGVARALLRHAERAGAAQGKTLLMLDTAGEGGSADFYESEGYRLFGTVPGHALRPQGGWSDTRFYFKQM